MNSNFNPLAAPFHPKKKLEKDDMELIRQKRLQKFLMRCARTGTEVVLDPTRQDNSTKDTMLEVSVECDTIGIPVEDRVFMLKSPLVPTPKTHTRDCMWSVVSPDPYAKYTLEEDEEVFNGFDVILNNMIYA